MGNWKIIEPEATTNLCTNPSFETNTTGWAVGGTNTVAQSSAQQWSGNYSGLITYQDTASPLIRYAITLPTASGTYRLTAYVYVPTGWDGGNVRFAIDSLTSATLTQVQIFTDGTDAYDTWLRIEASLVADTDVAGNIDFETTSAPTAGKTLYVDAIQFEEKSGYATTYCDGTLSGCLWTGTEHASTSQRLVTSRAGGRLRDFADDYDFPIESMQGTGMPRIDNITLDRSLIPGEEYQRHKVDSRLFSLVSTFRGTSLSDYHSDRQTLLKLLAPDSVPDDQPFILQYEGATTTKRIEAHYAGGLEMRGPRGYAETVALRFLAANNPLWYGLNETVGTLLAKSATVRLFVGWIDGAWDEFGPPNATGTYTDIRDILYVNESSIYICGDFVNFDNNGIDYIAHWNGSAWEAVGDPDSGTAVITRAYEMALHPDGTLYVVGDFTDWANVANADYIASWNGSAWSAVGNPDSGGAAITNMQAVMIGRDDNIYIGGNFTGIAGVSNTNRITYWDGAAYNAMGTGTNGDVRTIVQGVEGADDTIYAGGAFTTAGGTTVNYVASWNGSAWASMNDGFNTSGVEDLIIASNGDVYAGGSFTTTDGGTTVNRIAKWNGSTWTALGTGMDGTIYSLALDRGNNLYVGGDYTSAGGATTRDRTAKWNGASWEAIPIDLPGTPNVFALETGAGGGRDLYMGFNTTGTAYFSDTVSITNNGTARAFPIIEIIHDGTGASADLEYIRNHTTGKTLHFNPLTILPGESWLIDLRPGRFFVGLTNGKGVTSNVAPYSDVAEFYLLPGVNTMVMYASTAPTNITVFARWIETYWSID